jgi:hypothetical protein
LTVSEYRKAKRETVSYISKLQCANNVAIRELYIKQTRKAESVISRLPSRPLSDASRDKIVDALDRNYLYREIKAIIKASVSKGVKRTTDIDDKYVKEAFRDAGRDIDEKINAIFERINTRKKKLYNAEYTPVKVENRARYNLSDSIWGGIDNFSDKILAYIEGEIAAGKDPVKIAREIQQYLRTGPEAVLGRWGKLEVDTSAYRKRLGTAGADYRTQRVVRTELYNSIREADIESGNANPGATGMFEWRLSPSHIDWDCTCPEIAAGGPYTKEQIQYYTDTIHPQCRCSVNPVLKDHDAFIKELKDYVNGEDNGIADWAALYGV